MFQQKNYTEFIKQVESALSDESKLQEALDNIYQRIEDGINDLAIQNNDQENILTIVAPGDYFAPQNVFIRDVHLIKQKNGDTVVKY